MKFLKILFTISCVISMLTFSNCGEVKEISCASFDEENLIFSLSMFQTPEDKLYFVGEFDTLILKKWFYGFNEPYIERCGGYPDPNCDCYGTFEGSYNLNDTISFRTQLMITTHEVPTEIGLVDFDFNVDKFRYPSNRIYNTPDSIKKFIDDRIVEVLTVNDFQFHNALDVTISNHKLIDRIVIERNVGLVAISYNDKLYTLKK